MNRRLLLVFSLAAILAAPAVARAVDSAAIAKRAAILLPQNRVQAFRNMDAFFPYHVIKRGGPVAELPGMSQKLEVSYKFKGKRRTLDDLLARTRTQGFLVIKDGKIVDERYFNGANDKTKFTSWSVAKSFTSTLVGLALADGKIKSLDDPITEYLPELKGSGYDGVPINDILEMSSGVKFSEEYGIDSSDVMIMWDKTMTEQSQTFAEYASSLGRSEKPGSKFVYRSVDTAVLAMLVKRVTGKPLAQMLSERIWQPLGMEQDATWLTDRAGSNALEAGDCCINATLRDYARFGLLFLHDGKAGDRQLVPAAWVTAATNPQSRQVGWGHLFPGDPGAYGDQWWLIYPGAGHAYSAEGVFFQFIYVCPKYNMVIVKTSAYDDFWDDQLGIEQLVAFDAIGQVLTKH
ncbi:MAG TPA: serine hydrolase [Candidatus Binataceae bacterium]|nr:serine hydrolase [Candidatus Binataceae bacterium]